MEKPMIKNIAKLSIRVALVAAVAFPLLIAMSARAQEPAPPPPTGTNVAPAAGAPAATEATAERVIVTGSNIPTAEEVGPNPVDTYRADDIRKLGVRTATDFTQRLPATTGAAVNENIGNGGDGRTEINLRGLFSKETLVLVDGKRVAPVFSVHPDYQPHSPNSGPPAVRRLLLPARHPPPPPTRGSITPLSPPLLPQPTAIIFMARGCAIFAASI